MSAELFKHPVTGHLIRKMRVYLVTPASVNEYAFYGIGRFEDISGFTFDSSLDPSSMYQEALEIASKQLVDGGTLVIVIDPGVSEWTPNSRQIEMMTGHKWRVAILRVVDSHQPSTYSILKNVNITIAQVSADRLDQAFAVLNEMTLSLDRAIYPIRELVFH